MGYVGQSYKRKEDYRLLSETGNYVADMHRTGMLEAAVVRSTYAHAKIKRIDKTAAEELDGVFAVITAADIQGEVGQIPQMAEFRLPANLIEMINPVIKECPEDVLPLEKVVYVGQPVAIVLAENRYIAEDAASLVHIEYESLPVLTDPFEAMQSTEAIHAHMGDNIHSYFHIDVGEADHQFEQAEHVLNERIITPRVTASPIETRGVFAEYDARSEKLEVFLSTQVPFMVRSYMSQLLNMVEQNIRVVAPDMGGGFGCKCAIYPEDIMIPYLAKKFRRPIRWIEDRLEHLLSTRHARDQIHDVQVAFDSKGRILAMKDSFVVDSGAYNPLVLTCAYNTAAHIRGIYKIPHFQITGNVVMTNKTPNIAYRGAGRPEAVFTMDRIIDLIAAELELDPVEVIKANMIQPEEMPFDQGIIYRDGQKVVYDSGDYPAALEQALQLIDYDQFRQRQQRLREEGRYVGVGISSYIEGTGIGPYEGAHLRLDSTGQIMVYVGSAPHGQSHETTLAQICADEFGVSPEQVTVKAGDTDLLAYGVGTFASRGAVTAGNAVQMASEKLRHKMLAIAGQLLEVAPDELEIKAGQIFSKSIPEKVVSFSEIARAARPGPRCAVPAGMEPGVEATHYFMPPTVTYSSGFHVAEIEVDIETGFIDILNYVVVHDCGRVLNPMIVEGQLQGGVAQGIGAALYEKIIYDDNGQLLTGSYMDYLLPTSIEVPDVIMGHQEHLSTYNPMGIKGVGEGGTISPPAALANAVCDALRTFKIKINELPISPNLVLDKLNEARQTQA